jgi:hypothetical protein
MSNTCYFASRENRPLGDGLIQRDQKRQRQSNVNAIKNGALMGLNGGNCAKQIKTNTK